MLWLVVLLLLALWSVSSDLYREVPGPRRLPIVGNAFDFVGYTQEKFWELGAAMFAQYGDRFVVRLFGQHVLHVREPADVQALLSHSRNITKGTLYQFIRPLLGSGLIVSTGRTWHTRRKLLTPAFRFAALEQHFATFCAAGRRLADELGRRAQPQSQHDAAVDVLTLVSDRTLHTLFCTVVGLDPTFNIEGIEEYRDAVVNICRLAYARLTSVWMDSDLVFYNLPIGRQFKKNVDVARRFVDDAIERKRSAFALGKTEGRGSLVELLLEAESRGEIDMDGVRDELHSIMFAGHESTAAAVAFGLMLLAENEDVQERVYEEFASAAGVAELTRLPLLDAVVREVLRLYPSAPLISRLVDEDFHMNGLVVRRGTHVVVHLYQLQRHARYFSAPHAFRPERFLQPHHPYAYAPFSAGPRNCIGQKYAKLEIKCFLVEVVRRFRLTAVAPLPLLCPDLVLRPASPLRVVLRPR